MLITRRQVETLLLIGLGGFLGANARFLVSTWVAQRVGSQFPWGTLVVNFSGSLLLGALLAWAANQVAFDTRARLFLVTGFFGAYTTFSTFANESVALLQSGDWASALGNILGTNLVCLAGALVGLVVGSWL